MLDHLQDLLDQGRASEVLLDGGRYFGEVFSDPSQALNVAALLCAAAFLQKEWKQVIHWGEQGLALKAKDAVPRARIYINMSGAHMYLGNVKRAEKALVTAEKIMNRSETAQLRPLLHYSWAVLMKFLGKRSEEIAFFRQAVAGFANMQNGERQLQAQLAIAWALLLEGEVEAARPEMLAAEPLLAKFGTNEFRADMDLIRALYHRLAGNLASSEAICQTLLSDGPQAPRQTADAYWILGCVAQARGDLQASRHYGELGYEQAVKDYFPIQAARLEMLRRAEVIN